MKTEDAFIDASVTITCGADNTFSPSDPDWPQCVPSKLPIHNRVKYFIKSYKGLFFTTYPP